jgi:TonB family protein
MVFAALNSIRVRSRYGVYLRNSLLAALAIHFLLFYFFPPFEIKPYVLPVTAEFELVVPDNIEIPPPPKEIVQPTPMIVPSDDGISADDIDIAPNVFIEEEVPVLEIPQLERSRVFHVFDEAPELLSYVSPVYPELAMNAGIEGTAMLRVLVDEDGKVLSVDVIQSDVTPAMEEAAMVAARQFVFRPATQGTMPVKAYMAVPVTFRLR